MIWIEKVSADADQQHTLLTDSGTVRLRLRYHPVVQIWTLDAQYAGLGIYGVKLTLGTLHVRAANMLFDFVVQDAGRTGIDPFLADDFESGRCRLWFVTREEMREIRGAEVPA